jgi:hypothetical protein
MQVTHPIATRHPVRFGAEPEQPAKPKAATATKPTKRKPLPWGKVLLMGIAGMVTTLSTVKPLAPSQTVLLENRVSKNQRFVEPSGPDLPSVYLRVPLLERAIRSYNLAPQQSALTLEISEGEQKHTLRLKLDWQLESTGLPALNTKLQGDVGSFWKHLSEEDFNQAVLTRHIRPMLGDALSDYAGKYEIEWNNPQAVAAMMQDVVQGYTDETGQPQPGLKHSLAQYGITLNRAFLPPNSPEPDAQAP